MEKSGFADRFARRPSQAKMLNLGVTTDRFRSRSRGRSRSITRPDTTGSARSSYHEACDSDDEDEKAVQDIEEVWFPGGHADIGGGWPPDEPEKLALSHGPLVWMVREAQKSGLVFIPEKMQELDCWYEEETIKQAVTYALNIPQIEVNDNIVSDPEKMEHSDSRRNAKSNVNETFLKVLESSCTRGRIHDCLSFNQGIPTGSVLSWKFMEYLPFRRMDLQKDGSWKAIRWPLPMGEVRDIPDDVKIHNSVIRRMKVDENYRPGNLICAGGGRGRRVAPKELGMGEWKILREEGHPVGEVWVKKKEYERQRHG
jgi:hypothetical protein